jgi:hypothetical protein
MSWLLGDGVGSQALMAGVMGQLTPWMGSQGYMPGQFLPTQNVYDQQQARQQQLLMMQTMQAGAKADQERLEQLTRSAYGLFQTGPITQQQQAFIGQMAGQAVGMLPFLGPSMPGTIDSLFGSTGSQSLFGMGMAMGTRQLANAQGLTGVFGPQQLGELSTGVFADLYGSGNARSMRGIGGASAGQLFSEMTQRGLLPESDLFDQASRKFDSSKIASRLKEMSGAVSAMRDIFGDLGKSDAPMSELINGLEALTQNGLGRMDKSRLERTVREMQQMAKLAGVAIDSVFAMQSGAAQQAVAMGVDMSFAPQATQSALAFATAYGQISSGSPAFGKFNKEQMLAYDQQLTLGAAGSQLANQAGAILRLGDSGALSPGTEAFKIYERIKSGDASALDYRTPNDFVNLLEGSGVSGGSARSALLDLMSNQGASEQYGVAAMARNRQRALDVAPFASQTLQRSVRNSLEGRGLGDPDRLAGSLGEALSKSFLSMSPDNLADTKRRTDAAAQAMFESMDPADLAALGGNQDQQMRALREIAETGWSASDTLSRQVMRTPFINLIEAGRPETTARAGTIRQQVAVRARVAQSMSGLGQAGPLRRLVDELGTGRADLNTLAIRFLGGQDMASVLGSLAPSLGRISDLQKQIGTLADQEAAAATPEEKKAIRDRLTPLETELGELVNGTGAANVAGAAKALGVTTDELLRGRAGDRILDEAAVKGAREQAGALEVLKAFGAGPEQAKARHSKELLNAVESATGGGTARKQAMNAANAARENLFQLAKKSGKTDAASAEGMSDMELDELSRMAFSGKLGSDGLLALSNSGIGAGVLESLRNVDVGLGEYRKTVEDDYRRAEGKAMTISGELTIKDGKGKVTAKGVPDPSADGGAP